MLKLIAVAGGLALLYAGLLSLGSPEIAAVISAAIAYPSLLTLVLLRQV